MVLISVALVPGPSRNETLLENPRPMSCLTQAGEGSPGLTGQWALGTVELKTGRSSKAFEGEASDTVTLVIGDMIRWKKLGRIPPDIPGFVFADIEELSPALMAEAKADIVISPLLIRGADAVEVARRLFRMGFDGSYRVLSGQVPNPDIIRQEIRNVAPKLDFVLMVVPEREMVVSLTGEPD